MQGCRGWPPAGPSRPQRPSCFPEKTQGAATAPGSALRRLLSLSPRDSPGFCRTPMASLPSARVPKRWCGCQSPACRSPAGGKQHPAVTAISFFAVQWRKDSTLLTFLIWSDVIGLPSRHMAPSATIITLRREPRLLCCEDNQSVPLCRLNGRCGGFKSRSHSGTLTSASLLHKWSSQPCSGGISGMNTQSAPQAWAVTKARYLQPFKVGTQT